MIYCVATGYIMLYNFERQVIGDELDVHLETLTKWIGFLREVKNSTVWNKLQTRRRTCRGGRVAPIITRHVRLFECGWVWLFEHRPKCRRELGRPWVRQSPKAISGGPFQIPSNEGLCEAKVSSASPLDPFYWFRFSVSGVSEWKKHNRFQIT